MDVFIKKFDENAYKTAKKIAVEHEQTIGQVLSMAISLLEREFAKPGFAGLKQVHLGKDTRNLSMEIDDILYGGKA